MDTGPATMTLRSFVLLAAAICFAMGLSQGACSVSKEKPSQVAPVSSDNLRKEITLEVRGVNRKNGVGLSGSGFDNLWLHHAEIPPDGYFDEAHTGRLMKVTGTLTEDQGLPVFIHKEGEPIVQGMPAPEGTDLEKARHRFVLKNVKWEEISK